MPLRYFFPAVGWLPRTLLLIRTENDFILLVGSIGMDASVANMVKNAGGMKAFKIGTVEPLLMVT